MRTGKASSKAEPLSYYWFVPLYMIERRFAEQVEITDERVRLIEEINAEEGASWVTSFLTADRRHSYCLYEAPSPDPIVAAAQRAGIPADVVVEVERVYG
jgi:hypothetical protein